MPYHPSRPQAPVTWADLIHIQDTHGIRPLGTKPAKEARVLRDVYLNWEACEGLTPGRGYLMPIHLLTGHVRQHLRTKGHAVDTAAVRALIVNALNHPRSAMEVRPRPYRLRAA